MKRTIWAFVATLALAWSFSSSVARADDVYVFDFGDSSGLTVFVTDGMPAGNDNTLPVSPFGPNLYISGIY
jgi:hypothetical protein